MIQSVACCSILTVTRILDGPLASGSSGHAHCIGTMDTGIEFRVVSGNQLRQTTRHSVLRTEIVSSESIYLFLRVRKQ